MEHIDDISREAYFTICVRACVNACVCSSILGLITVVHDTSSLVSVSHDLYSVSVIPISDASRFVLAMHGPLVVSK